MIKKIKTYLAAALLAGLLATPIALPVAVSAQGTPEVACGADLQLNGTVCEANSPESEEKVNNMIKLAVNIFSIVVGIVSVIMIIVGGFMYVTSGGESGKITNAKNTILYAIIGLVIVAMAQIIVKFVLSRTASVTS